MCLPRSRGHCTQAPLRGWTGLGGGEGLGVTAQQFKDDWCQLLVGLSTGGKGRQTKTNMQEVGEGGHRGPGKGGGARGVGKGPF